VVVPVLARDMKTTAGAIRRMTTARNRVQIKQPRYDMRTWQVQRRARTRLLIELGGLVVKARLVELTGDDRAVILGGLLAVASRLSDDKRADTLVVWKQKGAAALAADAEGANGNTRQRHTSQTRLR